MAFPMSVIFFLFIAVFLLQFSSGNNSPNASKKSQFEKAFSEGDVDKTRELVSALEYFPGPKNWGKIHSKLRIVKLLLSNGIAGRIDNQNKDLKKIAYKEGEFDVFLIPGSALFWRLVVNVPAVKNWGNKTIEDGRKPIHIISLLPDVSPGIVKVILENGNDGVNTKTSLKLTPLMLAASSGNLEVVKFLVERGARVSDIASVSLKDKKIFGHFLFSKLLSRKQLNFVYTEIHYSALVPAIIGNNTDVVNYLMSKGADVNNHGECWVALFPAASFGQKEILDILFRSGIDVNCKDIMGSTALHTVAVKGHVNMVKILLKNGARLNITDSLGWTPIHVASFYSKNGGKDMIELLVQSGSDIKSLTDGGHSSLILVEAGYNVDLVTFLLKNVGNLTPTGHMDVPEKQSSKNHTDIVNFVIQLGTPLNQQDDVLGWTALHWAAAAGDLDVVKLLVQNGAKTDLKSRRGHDPLETATLFGRTKIAEFLKTAKG